MSHALQQRRLYVTDHALDRYRIHYPTAETADVLDAVDSGTPRSPELVRAITGRKRADHTASYRSATDHRGVFVVCGDAVVTYLRLQPSQQRLLDPALEIRDRARQIPALRVSSDTLLVDGDVLDKLQLSRSQLVVALAALDPSAVRETPPGQVELRLRGFAFRVVRAGKAVRIALPMRPQRAGSN